MKQLGKKLTAWLLCAVMLLGFLPGVVAEAEATDWFAGLLLGHWYNATPDSNGLTITVADPDVADAASWNATYAGYQITEPSDYNYSSYNVGFTPDDVTLEAALDLSGVTLVNNKIGSDDKISVSLEFNHGGKKYESGWVYVDAIHANYSDLSSVTVVLPVTETTGLLGSEAVKVAVGGNGVVGTVVVKNIAVKTKTSTPWGDHTTDDKITVTSIQNYADGSVAVDFTANGGSWPTMSIIETTNAKNTNKGAATLTFWAKASKANTELFFQPVYGGATSKGQTITLGTTAQKISIPIGECAAVTSGNMTLNIKPPHDVSSAEEYSIVLSGFSLNIESEANEDVVLYRWSSGGATGDRSLTEWKVGSNPVTGKIKASIASGAPLSGWDNTPDFTWETGSLNLSAATRITMDITYVTENMNGDLAIQLTGQNVSWKDALSYDAGGNTALNVKENAASDGTNSTKTVTLSPLVVTTGHEQSEWANIRKIYFKIIGLNAANNVAAYSEGDLIIDNITIYGAETPQTSVDHTVTFNSNGGSAVSAVSVAGGGKAQKPADPTKAGHSFVGWYSNDALTTAFDFDTAIREDITLYASWTTNTHKVTLSSPQGGTLAAAVGQTAIVSSTTEVKYGASVTLTATADAGYAFAAWDVEGSGGTKVNVENDRFTMPDCDVTVSATFIEKTSPVQQYTVAFGTSPANLPAFMIGSESTAVGSATKTVDENTSLTFTVADTYHDNDNWTYYKLKSVQATSGAVTKNADGIYTVNAAASITATYEALSWGFHKDNGVTYTSLTETAEGVPTLIFSAGQWKNFYLKKDITPDTGANGLAVTLNYNGTETEFQTFAKLGDGSEIEKYVTLKNGDDEIIYTGVDTSKAAFQLTVKPSKDGGVTNASLTVSKVEPVKLHTLTIKCTDKAYQKPVSVNSIVVDTNNKDNQGTAGVLGGKDTVIAIRNVADGDGWDCVQKMTVDGKLVKLEKADENTYTYTLKNVSADHEIIVTYEYSGTLTTPEEPAVKSTEVTTTTSEGTATVSDSTGVASALDNKTAAGITATGSNNVTLNTEVVTALSSGGTDAGDDGIVAVITTKNVTVEAPAAMFENAKTEGTTIAVTLKTDSKNASNAGGDNGIETAVKASGERTDNIKGALDISLVDGSNKEVEVNLGENAVKPITLRIMIEKNLDKNQLHVGYIKDGKLVYDDTVQLIDYDKTTGELSFTTTHYTTFVFVNGDPVWNFNSGLDGWSYGWNSDYGASTDGAITRVDNALKLSLDYTKTPSKQDPWPSFTVQCYDENNIPLNGKNYLSMDVYYDATALGSNTLLFAVGSKTDETKLITADNAQLNTYAATDATIDGKTMKKTQVLIGFSSDASANHTSMNIDIIDTSGSYRWDVYLDNITLGTASYFIKTSVNEDYRGTFIPGGRVPMLGETTTIYVVQKGSDQRIGKLTLDGSPVSAAAGKTVYQFTHTNDGKNHTLAATFEWYDNGGSSGTTSGGGGGGSGAASLRGVSGTTSHMNGAVEAVSTPTATVKNGSAAVTLTDRQVSDIVDEVAKGKTDIVTIRPSISSTAGTYTRSEVTVPASMLESIAESSVILRVESTFADVTIPSDTLAELGGFTGDIAVGIAQSGGLVDISIMAGGSTLTSLRGGIVAEVPVECGPGTVAVIVGDSTVARAPLLLASAGPNAVYAAAEDLGGTIVRASYADSKGQMMTVPLSGSAKLRFVDNAMTFTDIPETSFAKAAVDFVSSHGIFGGVGDNLFDPNTAMNRAMLVRVLHNLEGNPTNTGTMAFTDVPAGMWFAEAADWATSQGIINGRGDGTFGVYDLMTRQDLATVLYRFAGQPVVKLDSLSIYTDADQISDYAQYAMAWAVENNLITGVTGRTIAPKGTITRYQVAKLMMNLVSLGIG